MQSSYQVSKYVQSNSHKVHFNVVNATAYIAFLQWPDIPRLDFLKSPLGNFAFRMFFSELQEKCSLIAYAQTNVVLVYLSKNSLVVQVQSVVPETL